MSGGKFEIDMAAFSLKQHQDALTYLKRLHESGWSIGYAQKWLKEKQSNLNKQLQDSINHQLHLACPICGVGLILRAVYTTAGSGNKYGWRSCWECSNCNYEKYSVRSVKEWLTSKEKTDLKSEDD